VERVRSLLLALLCAVALFASGAALASPQYHANLGEGEVSLDEAGYNAPWAAPNQPGCTTDLLTTNFSSRAGAVPRILVAHYTVSSNVTGWGDVDAIRNYFNRSTTGASSTYVIDWEGNCKYIVSEAMKPWTQTVFNPYSISIEFIATGKESTDWWLRGKGLAKGAQVFADAAKRWDIPIRFVDPSGCGVPVKGITDHDALECNSHTDVKPNFPMSRFVQMVQAAAAPPPPPAPTIRFLLATGEGKTLATSGTAIAGTRGERRRLAAFLQNTVTLSLLELRRDGDLRVMRRKVG
jgi:hypothetical protein